MYIERLQGSGGANAYVRVGSCTIHAVDAAKYQSITFGHVRVSADGRGIAEARLGRIRSGGVTQRRVVVARCVEVERRVAVGSVVAARGVEVKRVNAAGGVGVARVVG